MSDAFKQRRNDFLAELIQVCKNYDVRLEQQGDEPGTNPDYIFTAPSFEIGIGDLADLLKTATQQRDQQRPSQLTIHISTMYGARERKPFVSLAWGAERADLSPTEARAHAAAILDVAAASEADAFIVDFLTDTAGLELESAVLALQAFRDWREAKGAP